MSKDEINIYKNALAREKAARKAAEQILEAKSAELYEANAKLEQLVKEKTSELRGVFENIVDAYVVIDLYGNVLKMNDAAINLLGYDNKQEAVNLNNLVDISDVDQVKLAFDNLLKEGAITNFKIKINTKYNQKKLVHINASIILNESKIPIAAQGIVRDITLLDSLERQKEQLMQRLEKSNDELQQYAHIVSHDLKSPLRSINALVSWLKEDNEGKLDAASLQNIAHIESTLEKMEQLISDILEYSSATSIIDEKRDVNLEALVHDVIDILYIPEHITITIKNKLPILIGDKIKLQQVFQNLLSNAIKFIDKPKGNVQVDVKALANHYQFTIADNGMGIEEKYFDKIFKVFHALNKSKESTGIGLSIVKKIIDLHEGEIWLESTINVGTTFYFTLKK